MASKPAAIVSPEPMERKRRGLVSRARCLTSSRIVAPIG